ncbi:perlucin-like protein [Lytechinus pictus]|uniref:perlucin-like protein n=1 Tax=Lytechinus pictus TaxID=7653 RepID=UPI0030BA0C9B
MPTSKCILSITNVICVGFMTLTLWTTSLQSADDICPSGWSYFSSNCYFLDTNGRTWDDGLETCQGYDAWLAEITSDAEQSFITSYLGLGIGAWIDCRDSISEGDWRCGNDDHPITFTGWAGSEPNNADGNEDCVVIYNGPWYDIPCTSQISALCKKTATIISSMSRSMFFKKDTSNPGYCLRNNVIEEIDQSTLTSCGGRCLKTGDCASINYFPRRDRCQLNSATKTVASDSDYVEVSNCEYFDIFS